MVEGTALPAIGEANGVNGMAIERIKTEAGEGSGVVQALADPVSVGPPPR